MTGNVKLIAPSHFIEKDKSVSALNKAQPATDSYKINILYKQIKGGYVERYWNEITYNQRSRKNNKLS